MGLSQRTYVAHTVNAIVSFLIVSAPGIAYLSGYQSMPNTNSEPHRFGSISDVWNYFSYSRNAIEDRMPLRKLAIDWDAAIDRRVFGEEPAFGGSATPRVVEGVGGFLFSVDAFEAGCNPHGTTEKVASNLARFASIIQQSGRDVVITVAPDKSSVLIDKLPEDHPLIKCYLEHQDDLWTDLKTSQIEGYIDLRDELRNEVEITREPLYLRQDSHWDSAGSLVAIKNVVKHFKSSVWDDSEIYYNGLYEYTGDLEALRGGSKIDQAPNYSVARPLITNVVSQYDEAYPMGYRRLSEMSGEPSDLVTGNTLVLFDSFGMAAIEQIVPYFQNLETMHFSNFETDKWVERIKASDNVWFLCVERALEYRMTYDLGGNNFLEELDKQLNDAE